MYLWRDCIVFLILLVTGQSSAQCFTGVNCTESTTPATTKKECCTGANGGVGYSEDGLCTLCVDLHLCYNNSNCTGAVFYAEDQRDCCIGTNDGLSYNNGSSCHLCIVHGFLKAEYDVNEDERLDTEFKLNVKGMTQFDSILSVSGFITAETAGTADNSDFERLTPISVTNTVDIRIFLNNDDICLEYDDKIHLEFVPDNPILISGLELEGEYIRNTATVNIIDNDLLEINFEESDYSFREGSDRLSSLVRLQFRETQNPFIITLYTATINEIFSKGLGGVFILAGPSAATAGEDFSRNVTTLEVPAYNMTFEIPEFFCIIDDDVNEVEQSFAVVAEIGADVPDSVSCFQIGPGFPDCYGRLGATKIRIADNDDMVIGFTERIQSISESEVQPEGFIPITINVSTLRVSESSHPLVIRYQMIGSVAIVEPLIYPKEVQFDALYGSRDNGSSTIEEYRDIVPASLQVMVYNDLIPEEQECFTLRIIPVDAPGIRTPLICSEGNQDDLSSFFCEHTICIQDDDGMTIGFASTVYAAFESDGYVEVCVDVLTPEEALRSFTVALIPEEGYDKSDDQYILECNVRLTFSVGDKRKCYNYTIQDDTNCELGEMETLFKSRLTLITTDDIGLQRNSSHVVATVTIDDRAEPECFVMVGYEKTMYSITEEERYVDICVTISSLGIEEDFSLFTLPQETSLVDSGILSNVNNSFNFSVSNSDRNNTECFNVSADYGVPVLCSYFPDCINRHLILELNKGTEGRVSNVEGRNVTDIEVQQPAMCVCEGDNAANTAGIIMVAVLVPSLLVGIAIVGILIVIVAYRNKRKKKRNIGLALPTDHYYHSLGESWRLTLLEHLKEQLENKRMIYSKDQLQLSTTVGQGESGLVYKGYIKTSIGKELCAIKTGKALFSKFDFERLAKEISTMLSFDHPNVMSLIGVCIDGEMPLLIMPFMSNGSVLDYIRHHKAELMVQTATNTLLGICHQISKGMEYLALHKFVHRDLAARNCMIDGNGVIKVADFGLTEDMYGTNYFRRDRGGEGSEEKVPIRWMAPESISNDIYNESTDMWSFGVTMWEVFTCGSVPYAGIHVMKLASELRVGYRLEKPDNVACDEKIYEVMLSCWSQEAGDRPTFHSLEKTLETLLEKESGYLKLAESLKWKEQDSHSPLHPCLPQINELEMDHFN